MSSEEYDDKRWNYDKGQKQGRRVLVGKRFSNSQRPRTSAFEDEAVVLHPYSIYSTYMSRQQKWKDLAIKSLHLYTHVSTKRICGDA